jgi:hypothetical protein
VLAALAAGLMGPVVLAQWPGFYRYYFVGHSSNEATVRAAEFGIHTLRDHLLFYAHSVLTRQTGRRCLLLVAAMIAIAAIGRWARDRYPAVRQSTEDAAVSALFFVCVMICTYVVLTADVSKSPIVGGQFVAVLLPLLWTFTQWMDAPGAPAGPMARLQMVAYLAVFVLGHATFVRAFAASSRPALAPAETQAFMRVSDDVTRLSRELGVTSPTLSFDQVAEYFHTGLFKVLAFEHQGAVLTPQQGLGQIDVGLSAISLSQAEAQVRSSDFAFIGLDRPGALDDAYPINRALHQFAPRLHALAGQVLVPLRDVSFFGRRVTFFARPGIRCTDDNGGWVTETGIVCRTFGAALQQRPLRLRGVGPMDLLGGPLHAEAIARRANVEVGRVSCAVRVGPADVRSSQPYEVSCPPMTMNADPAETLTVTIRFDRYFVSKERGMDEDARHLVVRWPAEAAFGAASELSESAEPARAGAPR